MNEDLEKIKQLIKKVRESEETGYENCKRINEVEDIAERMAAEIEKAYIAVRLNVEDKERATKKIEKLNSEIARLKSELEKYNIDAFLQTEYAMISKMSDADKMDLISRLLRVNNNLANRNKELTKNIAGLEKRPEVVRCGECEFCQEDSLNHKFCDKAAFPREVFYDDFCSHGQRRESEEGK